jgi:integrase
MAKAQKYLTDKERDAILEAALEALPHHRSLLLVLMHTGAKVSEAVELRAADIDVAGSALMLADGQENARFVPVPAALMAQINGIHALDQLQGRPDRGHSVRLWNADRTTAWRWIAAIMAAAGVSGPQASPRGLRHTYAVQAVRDGIPPATLQTWMGYTTAEMALLYSSASDKA